MTWREICRLLFPTRKTPGQDCLKSQDVISPKTGNWKLGPLLVPEFQVYVLTSNLQKCCFSPHTQSCSSSSFWCGRIFPLPPLCEQYTHKYSTYRVAQHDHISSREHAWPKSCKAQGCTSLYPSNNCHPRVMSYSSPHLTLTTSTSSLSPISSTSPIFPTVSPSQTSPVILNPHMPCDVPRQSDG